MTAVHEPQQIASISEEELAASAAVCAAATPAPWTWWLGKDRAPVLVHPRRSILIVMDAVRQGMNGASLRFARRFDDRGGVLRKAGEFLPAYQYRASEFSNDASNPDMRFITFARDYIPRANETIRQLRAEIVHLTTLLASRR